MDADQNGPLEELWVLPPGRQAEPSAHGVPEEEAGGVELGADAVGDMGREIREALDLRWPWLAFVARKVRHPDAPRQPIGEPGEHVSAGRESVEGSPCSLLAFDSARRHQVKISFGPSNRNANDTVAMTAATTDMMSTWGERLGEVGYRASHAGLALGLGATLRGLMRAFTPEEIRPPDPKAGRALVERFRALLEQDIENVRQGYYPRELLFQFPYLTYLRRFPENVLEFPRIASRKHRAGYKELPRDVDLSQYPKYYTRNFHWQTDGWFSRRSARMYDLQVEMLFVGTADIMRRMTIPPVVGATRSEPTPRILDLGTGTGRFLLQLSKALPQARITGLDLSPYYLKEAAETLAAQTNVSLVAENAESTPYKDEAFDCVTSVFLFHELPRATRRTIAREALRLLPSGGRFVVNDSAQLHDSEDLRAALDGFASTYHEPFYRDYTRDPVEDVLAEAGFEVLSSEPYSVSKVVVGRKP